MKSKDRQTRYMATHVEIVIHQMMERDCPSQLSVIHRQQDSANITFRSSFYAPRIVFKVLGDLKRWKWRDSVQNEKAACGTRTRLGSERV